MQRFQSRLSKELDLIKNHTPGVLCWDVKDLSHIEASVLGPDSTPYENGVFKIEIEIPETYPFVPPKLRFITPIHHPNIDSKGRICLDILKSPPTGSWKPSLFLPSVLTAVRCLMREPNFDDPLMSDIAEEYCSNRERFVQHALEFTKKYAMPSSLPMSKDENHSGDKHYSEQKL